MQTIIEKIKEVCKKHPIIIVLIIAIVLLVGAPLIIQAIYHTPAPCELLEEKIPPGSLLTYIGSVLTFGATFMLSLLVYRSNKEQYERASISENKAMLVIDNDSGMKTDVLKSSKKDKYDIFINVKLKILSKAMISRIHVTHFSASDFDQPRDDERQFYADCGKGKNVTFQYKSKDTLMITFCSTDEKLRNILCTSKKLSIGFDIVITCEDVKTILTMNMNCTTCEIIGEQTIIGKIFDIENANSAFLDAYIA
ncbi:hypothetical protein LIR06_12590 [Mediterraneibacter faecis]|uniref:hypothetical protein n=1 Tax=Mediterraneibacter faecis TaxID=592978 RepID=UPI0006D1875F|nr:hypothetical protein [Mediterraneibacter faecis]MCB5755750.1 hypothetical protein [Mediterraneibacter faecis]DAZ71556.1 MAG TPA: hypothetical protein [Caudoviricetes sp.]